uniref:Putative secreted protein n=1 Tax=Anopheles darlingi TaxID=43151 RepID=A0A2M4D269_ANODA
MLLLLSFMSFSLSASSVSYFKKTANESVFDSGSSVPPAVMAGWLRSLRSSLRFLRTVLESRSFGFSTICSALNVDLIGISSYSEDFRKFGDTGPSSVMPFCMFDFAFSTYIGRDTLRGIRNENARRKFEFRGDVFAALPLVGDLTSLLVELPPPGLLD